MRAAPPASNRHSNLWNAARPVALPWCPAGAGARPRATDARAQLAFALRFLAAGFFIGAFFFATVFAFAADLAMSFPSSVSCVRISFGPRAS